MSLSKILLGVEDVPYTLDLFKVTYKGMNPTYFNYVLDDATKPNYVYVDYPKFNIKGWYSLNGDSFSESSAPDLPSIISPDNVAQYLTDSGYVEPKAKFDLSSIVHSPTTIGDLKDRVYTLGALSLGMGISFLAYSAYNLYKLKKSKNPTPSVKKLLKTKSATYFAGGSLMVAGGVMSMHEASKPWFSFSVINGSEPYVTELSTRYLNIHIDASTKVLGFGLAGFAIGLVSSLLIGAYKVYRSRRYSKGKGIGAKFKNLFGKKSSKKSSSSAASKGLPLTPPPKPLAKKKSSSTVLKGPPRTPPPKPLAKKKPSP